MPLYTVDLHNHTPFVASDYKAAGATTAADLVSAAAAAGIDVFGVTDHVSMGFFREVERAAAQHSRLTGRPMLVVAGAELKVTWHDDEVHLIALFPSDTAEAHFRILSEALEMRLDEQPIDQLPRLTVEADPVLVAGLVHELGGMCHLAHADRWFGEYRILETSLFGRIAGQAPISAIECLDPEACEWLTRPAHGCRVIASSDSHDPGQIGRRTTQMELRELTFDALREAMRPWSPALGA